MSAPAGPATRYDGLDVLRAGAMLLGAFSHAARAYVPGYERWYPIADPMTHPAVMIFVGVLNSFQLQLFFALSGFFGHLVLEKRGADAFLRDRSRRLVVPFLAALPLLFAADLLVRSWSESRGLMSPRYQWYGHWRPAPVHLWFLEYLFVYCVIAWAFARRGLLGARLSAWLARALRRPEALLVLAAPLALALEAARGGNPARSFVLQPMTFLEFGFYFAFGWLLWGARDHLDTLKRRGGWLAAAGLAVVTGIVTNGLEWRPFWRFLLEWMPWLVTLGAIGLALRVPSAPRPRLRFLIDASYWVYLVHLPIVQLLQIAFGGLAWPALVKYALVLAITFGVAFTSFAWFVRGTALGAWLGAPPRGAPAGAGDRVAA